MARQIKFEYGFQSVNGIVKKHYYLHDIPNIKEKCDLWNVLPIVYVREFTGKHTKSGSEIYDGDKLSQTKSSYWLVKWSDSNCGWHCYQYVFSKDEDEEYTWKKSNTYPLGHSLAGLLTYNYEVIGNIHESEVSHA